MASIASQPRDVKPVLPVSPASSGTMMPSHEGPNGSPMDGSEITNQHHRNNSFGNDDDLEDDDEPGSATNGQPPDLANAEGPRKRRRSRKGLDKRFECTAEGCGKSYSRAEHL
jgi:hypothetical protein